ncbi:MAG: hypothetical protein ACOVNU_13980 [Candidatus Kapaibacteriota bacterium]
MKQLTRVAAMLAMQTISMIDFHNIDSSKSSLKPEDIDVKPKPKVIPKGCKVFIIEGKEIIAINEKSAKRKFLKTQ